VTNAESNAMPERRAWLVTLGVIALACAIVIGCPACQDASAQSFSLTGYWKNYSTVLHQPDVDGLFTYENRPLMGSVSNRLRLKGHARLTGRISLTAAYDISPRVQDKQLFDESLPEVGSSALPYRAADFDYRLYPDDKDDVASFAVFHNLDRLFLTARLDRADVYIGRQAVAWGSSRIVNPTDIFIPFAFNELDVEDRIGVDAARVRVPIGMMSEIDAGFLFGDEFMMANSAWYLRGRHYLVRSDLSAMIVGFRKNLLVGFDLARAVGGAGVWLEAAHVFIGAFASGDEKSGEDYFRGSIGCDYVLRDGTYLFIEYHYNQAGIDGPENYLQTLSSAAYADGAVYLLGEHYLAPGAAYQITPLITLTGQVLANLADPSGFVMTSMEYNIAENIYVSGGAYLGLGDNPEYNDEILLPSRRLQLRSEFGTYPDVFFTSFRMYF